MHDSLPPEAPSPPPPPLAIAGMHRSGTSLTAAFLQQLGLDVGDRLYAADRANARGYFEDVDFLEFQRHLLQACCPPHDGGWPDWGWTESERLARERLVEFVDAANTLIAARQTRGTPWGWKDPRTTLLLDFWRDRLPDARFVLLYRPPWDVADSIVRLHTPPFTDRPEYILKIWRYYNRHLLDFYQRHRDRCLLVSVNALVAQPHTFATLLHDRLGVRLSAGSAGSAMQAVFDPDLFRTLDAEHPFAVLVRSLAPDCLTLLVRLDAEANMPSPLDRSAPGQDQDRAIAAALQLHEATTQLQQQIRDLEAERERLRQAWQAERETLQAELDAFQRSKFGKLYRLWHRL